MKNLVLLFALLISVESFADVCFKFKDFESAPSQVGAVKLKSALARGVYQETEGTYNGPVEAPQICIGDLTNEVQTPSASIVFRHFVPIAGNSFAGYADTVEATGSPRIKDSLSISFKDIQGGHSYQDTVRLGDARTIAAEITFLAGKKKGTYTDIYSGETYEIYRGY